MAKSMRASSEELKAFFRACEKNGVEISSVPNKGNEYSPIIVNKNGHRFAVSDTTVENPAFRLKNIRRKGT